jgi:hypothetical protein
MKYTCSEYRAEMMLLGLERRLQSENLSEKEKAEILAEIRKLKEEMGLD